MLIMSEHTGEPTHVKAEPIMVVDRMTQELITQQLNAAIEQLDIIATAIRDDPRTTNLSLLYVSAVNARALVDGALKDLPWAPIPGRHRAVTAPPPPPAPLPSD